MNLDADYTYRYERRLAERLAARPRAWQASAGRIEEGHQKNQWKDYYDVDELSVESERQQMLAVLVEWLVVYEGNCKVESYDAGKLMFGSSLLISVLSLNKWIFSPSWLLTMMIRFELE